MILLTKIDGVQFAVNAEEIETAETAHDTIIMLKSGRRLIVKENYDEIIGKVIAYKRECYKQLFLEPGIESKSE